MKVLKIGCPRVYCTLKNDDGPGRVGTAVGMSARGLKGRRFGCGSLPLPPPICAGSNQSM